MTLYTGVVFLHVISAIALVGSTLLAPFMGAGVRRTTTVEGLREWAVLHQRVGKFVGAAAPVTLLTGVYLAFSGDWWGSGWVEVSLVLFVLAGVGALGVLDPAVSRLVEASEAAPNGPITAELEGLRHDRRVATAEAFMLPGDIAIVFLMTNKPELTGALSVFAIAFVVGAVLQRVRSAPSDRMAPA